VGSYPSRSYQPKRYAEQHFDLEGLEGISDAQIAEHLTLYAGYVKQVNQINQQLAELTRRLGFEYNGMILHEYYSVLPQVANASARAETVARPGQGPGASASSASRSAGNRPRLAASYDARMLPAPSTSTTRQSWVTSPSRGATATS